ncbi:MAG: extracellular solute-binding protein [Chloroflexi bacterium]|nr:extracellular solute-binding protein [Chloroflexota bacterium]
MSKMSGLLVVFAIVLVLQLGCGGGPAPLPGSGQEQRDARPAAGPAKAGWEAEWEEVLARGKSEGVVVVINDLGATQRETIRKTIQETFGINMESVAGGGTQTMARTKAERSAGLYTSDALIGGATTQKLYREAGFLDPIERGLIFPDIKDPKNWRDGKFPYLDKDGYSIIFQKAVNPALVVNTEMVRPEDVNSYQALLDPKWKGKITMRDPTVSGGGHNAINSIMWELMGEDYVRAFAKQEPLVTRDQRLMVETVARGKYPIGLAPDADTVLEFEQAGAPVKRVLLKEGSGLAASQAGFGILNRPAHPNAQKVFVNWLLSKEGQLIAGKATGYPSMRADVPTDYVDPIRLPQPGTRYIDTDDEEQVRLRGERQPVSKEIFGVR